MKKETAILLNSFKSKRLDGHSVLTIFALLQNGIVVIERRIVSTELNEGFVLIRKIGNFFYQKEEMLFKFDSFHKISTQILRAAINLDLSKFYTKNDVSFELNEKIKILIESPRKNESTKKK